MIRIRLAQLLLDREMKLAELARRVGVDESNLWRLKKGKASEVRLTVLDELCRALRCQPGDLLAFEDSEAARKVRENLPPLEPNDRKVLEACQGTPTHVDTIVRRSGMSASACLASVTNLELARLATMRAQMVIPFAPLAEEKLIDSPLPEPAPGSPPTR